METPSPNELAAWTVVGTALSGAVAFIVRLWFQIKTLFRRVKDLEENEDKFLGDYINIQQHKDKQSECRREIYKDMKALEEKIEKINHQLKDDRYYRESLSKEDLKWKAEMAEAVVEIRTIVKQRLN